MNDLGWASGEPTPTTNITLPFHLQAFETISEGLDYAAQGETGYNFYSVRRELIARLTYTELRDQAIELAQRLVRAGFPRGSRVAIVAETNPEFLCFFFGCQYAGLVPVPLPLPVNLGGREEYVQQIGSMIKNSGAVVAAGSAGFIEFLRDATVDLPMVLVGCYEEFQAMPRAGGDPRPLDKDELCYIQYSSGSTRSPRGIAVTQRALVNNCHAVIRRGLAVKVGDRGTSWLPLYHDMGLVGFCLAPVFCQITIDYIATADFARRPLLWLDLLSANRSTLSFSPTFGYDLCVRRAGKVTISSLDLESWRVAGIGGEMIRPDVLNRFAETFADHGFRKTAFVASYGLAESTLAVSFTDLDSGLEFDRVNKTQLTLSRRAVPAKGNGSSAGAETRTFVICGRPIPGHAISIRSDGGEALPDRRVGTVFVQGPSVMAGYIDDEMATQGAISADGWLDTGDMGYLIDGSLVISGRAKDLIVCNGRNIWPQDIEWSLEEKADVRRGDAAAFSVMAADGVESVVVVVQCRLTTAEARRDLKRNICGIVRRSSGVDPEVVLVPPRSLPLTSSGKLSRSTAKQNFLSGMYAEPVPERETRSAVGAD